MRSVVCPHCNEVVYVPDDLARAHCVRCGLAIALSETHVTDSPPPAVSQAFQASEHTDRRAARAPGHAPTSYANWDEFRSTSSAVQRELSDLATRALPDLRTVPVLPIPDDAPEELNGWDRLLGTITIGGEPRLVGKFAFVLFSAVGLLMIFWGIFLLFSNLDPSDGTLILVWAVAVLATGTYLGFVHKPSLSATLWVFEEGLFLRRFGRSMAVRWDDVQNFEASTDTGRPLFWLTLAHDMTVVLSAGHAPQVVPLLEYIEIRLTSSQFLRRLHAIWDGRQQRFGIVWLNREGVRGPDFFAFWPEVQRVFSDSHVLYIDSSGADQWTPRRYREVSFPYLVMAIAKVMIEEHRRFPKDADGFV